MRLHSPTFGEQARPPIVTETTLRMEFHTIIKEMRGIDKKFSPHPHSAGCEAGYSLFQYAVGKKPEQGLIPLALFLG